MKTSELTGAALDWAVAKAEYTDRRVELSPYGGVYFEHYPGSGDSYNQGWTYARFSTDWSQGGPIIEREGILLRALRSTGHSLDGQWLAMYDGTNTDTIVRWVKRTDWPRHYLSGPTPLIAAMRCYVASKLGDEVDIPAELEN